jgi:predicted anti-sigma-YlaC factor YlaD
MQRRPARLARAAVLALSLGGLAGCGAIKGMALRSVADTLASGTGGTFSKDDDLELIGDAAPFGLKLYESLLESLPDYVPLLTGTCGSFTQYTYAIVQTKAESVEDTDYEEFTRLNDRALKLYLRGREYCLRALEERFPGIRPRLLKDPAAALSKARKKDVELLYWSAASWGAAISIGLSRPELAGDLHVVRGLAERALQLDETWNQGALHELMISLDSQGEIVGGSVESARKHFARAVELQKGLQAGPYVSLATGVALAAQDRAEFTKLLEQALAVDPDKDPPTRLPNIVAQLRAKRLLAKIDALFPKTPEPQENQP